MENKVIRGAAKLYYSEYVLGEPLDQDIPIMCFEAGAQYVINSQKKRNNCNTPKGNSYKTKKKTRMDIYEKIIGKAEEIIKVSGFYITAPGDESVGIQSASWEMRNDFYFDTPEELEEFRKEIKQLYEFHCGEVTSVVTFEEYNAELEAELIEEYKAYPVRYLIRYNKGSDNFMKEGGVGMYSSDVAQCIRHELPHFIAADNELVIPSTSDEYWEIIKDALYAQERTADVNGQHYHGAKNSIRNLLQELNYGTVSNS
jgi:hypothetical protein